MVSDRNTYYPQTDLIEMTKTVMCYLKLSISLDLITLSVTGKINIFLGSYVPIPIKIEAE